MELQTILWLCAIGLIAGILSGFVGIGGGIVIVPALVYHCAQRETNTEIETEIERGSGPPLREREREREREGVPPF